MAFVTRHGHLSFSTSGLIVCPRGVSAQGAVSVVFFSAVYALSVAKGKDRRGKNGLARKEKKKADGLVPLPLLFLSLINNGGRRRALACALYSCLAVSQCRGRGVGLEGRSCWG